MRKVGHVNFRSNHTSRLGAKVAAALMLLLPLFAEEKNAGVGRVEMDDSRESAWKLQDISGFAVALRDADSLIVLEGLPYPEMEKRWYEHESKRKDLIWIRDYPFYPHPLKVSDIDLVQIKEVLLDPAAHLEFPAYLPSLLTEGYHPNFAVLWSKGGQRFGSLMDLYCRREWKNFTPAELLYGRISSVAYAKLSKVLGKYHQEERPEMMFYRVSDQPPSDPMRALVRAIIEHGILSKLTQGERVPVRDVESLRQVEWETISPSGSFFRDTVTPEAVRAADPNLFKKMPKDELMIVRELDGSRYWIIRETDYGAAEAFLGPDIPATPPK